MGSRYPENKNIKNGGNMARKVFWLKDANLLKTDYSESNVRVNIDMKGFVASMESRYEIVGIYFEKYKVGFILREKQ